MASRTKGRNGKVSGSEVLANLQYSESLLSVAQAAAILKLTDDAVVKICKRGELYPARIRDRIVLTRADVERYAKRVREHGIVHELEKGTPPIRIYALFPDLELEELARAMDAWGRVTGAWLVQGPRGSFARWLERFGLLHFEPRHLRRVIESLISDPYVQKRARLSVVRHALEEKSENTQAEEG
jgi:hypothetical protein